MRSNDEEQKSFGLKNGDIAYLLQGFDWMIYISQVRITGPCCDEDGNIEGKGYCAVYTQPNRTQDKTYDEIHTCNLWLVPRLKDARRQAQIENKKWLEKLKDKQRSLSHQIHYTSFYLKYPNRLGIDGHEK
jgi:hypothetical protein